MPLVLASFVLGTLSEYEQNIYLYSVFTIVNGFVGGCMFFFHCTANQKVRAMLVKFKNKICPKKEKDGV